jgi:L-aspartate oxidase
VDVEFVQFHPTALAVPGTQGGAPLPLLTEALRGEGAVLIDGSGYRFMADEHPDRELAPRDVVARALWRRLAAGDRIYLDATRAVGDRFPERFPTVYASCRAHGIDPRVEPVPVAPAAHYHMGGIAVDGAGRSSLPGLWACGEVAATGAHGANRLASNSLLEALVFGAKVAADLRSREPRRLSGMGAGRAAAVSGDSGDPALTASLRRLMWESVGVEREGLGLAAALESMDGLAERYSGAGGEARNLLTVGRLVAGAALLREESRGSHYRTDFPESRPEWQHRLYLTAAPDGSIQTAEEARRAVGAHA